MKNLFLTVVLLLSVSFSFATNGLEKTLPIKTTKILKVDKEKEKKPICTVTCTAVMADGTTYTATAGNWFSTCSGAERRCKLKLFDMIFE